jgi:hypothetical protein
VLFDLLVSGAEVEGKVHPTNKTGTIAWTSDNVQALHGDGTWYSLYRGLPTVDCPTLDCASGWNVADLSAGTELKAWVTLNSWPSPPNERETYGGIRYYFAVPDGIPAVVDLGDPTDTLKLTLKGDAGDMIYLLLNDANFDSIDASHQAFRNAVLSDGSWQEVRLPLSQFTHDAGATNLLDLHAVYSLEVVSRRSRYDDTTAFGAEVQDTIHWRSLGCTGPFCNP